MLPLLETFFGTPIAEYLSVQPSPFCGCLQYPEVFNFRNQFLGQKLTAPYERENCHGGESNRWARFQAFF
jgi:hypothetical protein